MMKTSEIVHKQGQIDIDIRHRQIINDICVYQVGISSCGIILQNTVRFCYCSELKNLYNYPIKFSNMKYREIDNFNIYKSKIKEDIIKDSQNMFISEYRIDKFDILQDDINYNGEIILGKIDNFTDNFYEYGNNIPCAKSIPFDYINGNVHNGNYHLEKLLKILENRKDITINRNKYTFAIRDIPHYNADYNKDMYIDFTWHPMNEDWVKYINSKYFESINRYEYIANEILGLKECLLKENNND